MPRNIYCFLIFSFSLVVHITLLLPNTNAYKGELELKDRSGKSSLGNVTTS